jgi:hypothetical protein
VAVRFIGGGNRSTWRKPPTCGQVTDNIVESGIKTVIINNYLIQPGNTFTVGTYL